jgi:hypothetical protein
MKRRHLFFLLIFLIGMAVPVRPDVFYYYIQGDGDDGMELDDSIWMENGYVSDEPNNYLGRVHTTYFDGGLRFLLNDRQQGEEFVLARLRLVPTVSNVQSLVRLVIRGVYLQSPAGFSQENRPSLQAPLTTSYATWDIEDWPADEGRAIVQSPDISMIINEILAQPDWGTGPEGKTIALLIDEESSPVEESNYVAFEDNFGGEGRSAILELYETPVDTFIGGPVLHKPRPTKMSLSFVAGMAIDFYVLFGDSPDNYTRAIGSAQTDLPAVNPVFGLDSYTSRELEITGLSSDTRYYYRVVARKHGIDPWEAGPEHTFITRRPPGESFHFVVLADSHAGSNQMPSPDLRESGFRTIDNAKLNAPDFAILGGDESCTDGSDSLYDAVIRYSRARTLYGPLGSQAPLFLVLGNHEGECSFYPERMQNTSRLTRLNFFFNPDDTTYIYGGHPEGHYYAWEWGDALFVCLDICFDTGVDNPKYIEPYGIAWTLGLGQRKWLESVLAYSQARWKFIFAHHLMASYEKSGYGRGGAKYAHQWEQGEIHRMMKQYGAQIFFHSHDHVFADGTAEGIHYTLCSMSTGLGIPGWASDPYFIDAYPYGFDVSKGHIDVAVNPRSVWLEMVQSSLDDELDGRIIYSYHLADVTVELTPPPVREVEGDTLSFFSRCPEFSQTLPDVSQIPGETIAFSAFFRNHTEMQQSFDFRITVSFENGGEFLVDSGLGVLLGPRESASIQSVQISDTLRKVYRIHIPEHAGAYTVKAETGEHPDVVMSTDAFTGTAGP